MNYKFKKIFLLIITLISCNIMAILPEQNNRVDFITELPDELSVEILANNTFKNIKDIFSYMRRLRDVGGSYTRLINDQIIQKILFVNFFNSASEDEIKESCNFLKSFLKAPGKIQKFEKTILFPLISTIKKGTYYSQNTVISILNLLEVLIRNTEICEDYVIDAILPYLKSENQAVRIKVLKILNLLVEKGQALVITSNIAQDLLNSGTLPCQLEANDLKRALGDKGISTNLESFSL